MSPRLEKQKENPQSYKTLPELFNAISVHWQDVLDRAKQLGEATLSALPPEEANKKLPGFVERQGALEGAVNDLKERLDNPELTLAMAGTTSSGKSTLVNLLVGDDIMPSAVQEMSAGVVQIKHSATERSLKIEKTKGATWETGVWENLTSDELRERLDVTMRAFRAAEKTMEETGGKLDPVAFHVTWPIYMGLHPERFGLPDNVRLTLLDLPGLKAIDDPRNGPVIQDNIKKALSLVVYNSAETDKDKQKKLLESVAGQVQKLRASPDRMLFVLNRIDVFAADREKGEENRKRFVQEITTQLRDVIRETLPEHSGAAERITPVTLSSRPALLGRKILDDGCSKEEKMGHVRELDKQFQEVVSDDVWDDLPRKISNANDEQVRKLAERYIEASGLPRFEDTLSSHIGRNLPSLLLQDVISEAKTALSKVLTYAGSILDETKINNEEMFKERASKLEELFKKVGCEQERILSKITSITDVMNSGAQDTGADLSNLADSLSKECGEENLLTRLAVSEEDVIRIPYEFVTVGFGATILGSSDYERSNGRDRFASVYEDGFFAQVGDKDICRRYYNSLVRLRKSPYGPIWNTGGLLEAGQPLNDARDALEEFAEELGEVCQRLFSGCAEEYGQRIEDILQRYIGHLINQLEESLNVTYAEELQHFPSFAEALTGMDRLAEMPHFSVPKFAFSIDYQEQDERAHTEYRQKTTFLTLLTLGLYKKTEEERVVDQKAGVTFPDFELVVDTFLVANGCKKILSDSLSLYMMEVVKNFRAALSERFGYVQQHYKQAQEERLEQLKNGLQNDEERLAVAHDAVASLRDLDAVHLAVN